RPAPVLDGEMVAPEDPFHYRATAQRLTFAEARRRGRRVLIEIRRNGSPVQKVDRPIEDFPAGPLKLWVKRDGCDLAIQVNRHELVELRDPFPIGASRTGVFAVRWPEEAGLVSLVAEDILRAAAVTPLEQADARYAEEQYEAALSLYALLAVEAREIEVQQEARFKRGLCLMHLNRGDEAMQVFQPLMAEPGDRWPPQAGVHLWLLLLRQNRYEDADAVYELLASRFTFEQLALMVPADVRDEILAYYLRAFSSIGNALAFRPEQIEELERAAAVDRFLSYDGQGELMAQVDLSRGYRYLGDYESSLAVLEPIVRSTYHSVPWRHYLRTLRRLDRTDEALRESNRVMAATHSAEHPNFTVLHDRIYIHAARGDWESAEAEVLTALRLAAARGESDFHIGPYFWLLGGFVRADRGDEPGAEEYWRQGYRAGQDLLQRRQTADAAVISVLIMGALCGELTEDEVWRVFQATAAGGGNPLLALASQMVNERTLGRSLRRMWLTPRGREMARAFAYDTLTLEQRVEDLAKLAASQYAADVAFGGTPTIAQQDAIWNAFSEALDQLVKQKRLNAAQVAQLGLSWKGTTNFLGWQGVAPSLDPSLRGPLAYVLAHRYVRLNNLPQAERLLQTVVDDAPADSALAGLAREELLLVKEGQARLQLKRDPPPGADDAAIDVIVRRDGEEVQRLALLDVAEVDLAAGTYQLAVAGAEGDWLLGESDVTLAVADRALVSVSPRWRPAPDVGRLAGLLPAPADLPETGRWQVIAPAPLGAVQRVVQHPQGLYVAAAGHRPDATVRVYDAELKLVSAIPLPTPQLNDMSWRPDGDLLALIGTQPFVELWDPLEAKLVARWDAGQGNNLASVAWSPDGGRLAAGAWNGTLYLWNAGGDRLLERAFGMGAVTHLSWRPDAGAIAFATNASQRGLWEIGADTVTPLTASSELRSFDLAFAPDGARIAAANDQGVDVWDRTGRHERFIPLPAQYSSSVAWEADGRSLWVRTDRQLHRIGFDEAEREPAPPVVIPADNGLLYDPASGLFTGYRWPRRLVRFGDDGEAAVEGAALESRVPLSIVWHPDGDRFVMATDANDLRILDAQGRITREVESSILFRDATYSPDRKLLAGTGADGWVRIYGVDDESLVSKWLAHPRPMRSIAFHPGGEKLVTTGDDNTVRLWTV
ncbi:MAG: hypothetical protein KY475_24485, partial [Planctomycetes bacterium]|nr:hypothetical protein [Planctomycetota bacterium]